MQKLLAFWHSENGPVYLCLVAYGVFVASVVGLI